MTDSSVLRAAAAIVEAAADRNGYTHWKRIAGQLNALADRMSVLSGPSPGDSTLEPQLHREEEQCP